MKATIETVSAVSDKVSKMASFPEANNTVSTPSGLYENKCHSLQRGKFTILGDSRYYLKANNVITI